MYRYLDGIGKFSDVEALIPHFGVANHQFHMNVEVLSVQTLR